MRPIKFKLFLGSVFQGFAELEPGGIIDKAYKWDNACQFTGLFDKQNKDICEGDIVTWPGWDGINYQVCYDRWGIPALAGVNCMEGTDFKEAEMNANATPDKCVVLGNVFENPELLEVNK